MYWFWSHDQRIVARPLRVLEPGRSVARPLRVLEPGRSVAKTLRVLELGRSFATLLWAMHVKRTNMIGGLFWTDHNRCRHDITWLWFATAC